MVRFNPSRDAFDVDVLATRFASVTIPIPALLEVGEVDGGFYAISARAFGEFLEELAPETMQAAAPSVLSVLYGLREADTSASNGFGPWDSKGNGRYASWAGYLLDVQSEAPQSVRSGWRDNLARSEVAVRVFASGTEALQALVARCPDRRDTRTCLTGTSSSPAGGSVP